MLSIGKLGKGQERYYLDKVAEGAEDYYSGEGEVAGQWLGDAAEDLGLSGEVEAAQLEAMLTGRSPVDGEPLVGMRGVPANGSVPGFDLTFSAPKSVSLLWGLGGPVAAIEVNAAHREAVGAALDYMQREACWTRRGAGGSEFVKGNGYLAAGYVHRSSRNGDPQLHTHVLIANATRGPDGRWTRLYHPAIYDHAKTASYIYEAHLRHELTRRLGVEWQPTRKGIAEIAGFADEHLRAFSTRRAEILEAAGADASARSMQVAALATRQPKERDVSRGELLGRWRSRADEIGLDRETIERTFDPEAALRPSAAVSRTVSTQQVDRAVTAAASHFDRRDAIQAVADSLPSGAPGAEVERLADAFLASESVIQIAEAAKGPRFTTRRIWELEREALAAVERMRAQGPTPAGELIAARVIHTRPTLKDDQREMVRRLLINPEGIAVVIGEAGSGKTFAVVAAAEGWAEAGIELRAAAPTWRAANVMRAEGLPASSIASLLLALDRAEHEGKEGLPHGSVLLVDEAGMVDSATLARLVSHAERAQAKLVLVGDPEQLGEIEAGGLFRALAERTDPIQLDEVIRHRHELDRVAAKQIREGEGGEALSLYRSSERVTVAPNAEERREAMVRDWHEAFERGEDAVMVAKQNAEVRRLNEMAREVRRQAGQLGAQEIEVGEASFAAGDLVITRVNDRSAEIFNRERWRIAEVDAAERRMTLDGIDQAKRVEVGADYLAQTNRHSEAPALEHAYAVTTYSAQGTSVDRAFVAADPSMDKQELYVAASRTREETFIYATPEIQVHREEIAPESPYLREGIPHIAEAAERDRAQVAAHDEALRSKFSGLPTEELVARRGELLVAAGREANAESQRRMVQKRFEEARKRLDQIQVEREAAQGLPRRQRREELARIDSLEKNWRDALARRDAEIRELPESGRAARRELAVANQVLAQRRELAIVAARISPPAYVKAELGERPSDPVKREAWDRGLSQIERYRQDHGIKDPFRAFGAEAKQGAERARQEATRRRLLETQRMLGLGQHAGRARDLGRDLGIGR
ncbi:MAG TPA: MobF family relaxase [Solirubrobacterales bacterium]|nr:MobF family relaxase [Solirubrobacterales bacterium]